MRESFPSKWNLYPLEECMDIIIDYRGKTPRKTNNGIPLITAKIVKKGRIEEPNEFIAPEDYETWMRRGIPKPGDVVITTEAPLGEVAQLDNRKVALAQRLITLRGKEGLIDNTFLKYVLQSSFVQNNIKAKATGTTVLGVKQSEFKKVPLPVPPLSEQKAIALILGALDDKIELNRKMNETLEAMSRAIFKSWFVDFDPIPGHGPHKEWQDSPLGKIPKGWEVGTMGEICENHRVGVNPWDMKPGTPYIGLEHMPRKNIALSEWGFADNVVSNKFFFKKGEILFGKLRPYFHKVGVTAIDGVCSTDILVINSRTLEWYGLVLSHLSSDDFVNYTEGTSSGTKMPRTNWTDIARYRIMIPPETIARKFTDNILHMIHTIQFNIHQSRTLASIRDTLLPKLLSGEIRVQDADRFVGDKI